MNHIYIHVPFCSRRCIYCDFSIAVRREIPAGRYVDAVVREYEHRKASGDWDDAPLRTLYLGGGTPSLLPAEHINRLVSHIVEGEGSIREDLEVTLEANPENVNPANARAWTLAGINRVSLGAQSFSPKVLDWMHRSHTPRQVRESVGILRDAGVESLSLDLICALPPHLDHSFQDELSMALALDPDHFSVYGLTVEPRTALSRWITRGAADSATDEVYERDFLLAHELLFRAGYEHYEVSNYAKVGRRSGHNSAYWEGSHYAGLGPSAHGFDGRVRRWNVGPWAHYERQIAESGDATGGRENLTADQLELERVYLGLRVSEGLGLGEMSRCDAEFMAHAEQRGWATSQAGRWQLTERGWLCLDEIVAALTT